MATVPKHAQDRVRHDTPTSTANAVFLKFLPAIETHAKIQFRHLPAGEKEEMVAEVRAAAFANFVAAHRRGKTMAVTASTLAHFAVLHAKSGRHVGGTSQSTCDVLSPLAQRRHGFRVVKLPMPRSSDYDITRAPDVSVWRDHLLHDRCTPVPDQVQFRVDFSQFLAGQTDRTRTAVAMLAAGHKQTEIADQLGLTPSAVCQRIKRAERDWNLFVSDAPATKPPERKAPPPPRPSGTMHPRVAVATVRATTRVPPLRLHPAWSPCD